MAVTERSDTEGAQKRTGDADVVQWNQLLAKYKAEEEALQKMHPDLEVHADNLLLAYSYMNQAAEMQRRLLTSDLSAEEREILEADYRTTVDLAISNTDKVIRAMGGGRPGPDAAGHTGEQSSQLAVICALSLLATALLLIQEFRIFPRKAGEAAPPESPTREEYATVNAFLEAVAAPLFVVDNKGRIVRFNQTCAEITGSSMEEVRNRFIWDLFLDPAHTERVRNIFADVDRADFPEHIDLDWQVKDGARMRIDWSLARLSDDASEVKYVVGVGNPAAKQKETDEIAPTRRAEKLAATVSLTFNDLLTAINGYSDLLLNSLEADTPLRRDVEEIKSAGERAALLSHQLQVYGQIQRFHPRHLDLNEEVRGHQQWLGTMLGDEIELVTAFDGGLLKIEADPVQLRRILEILTANARDAMPEGGRFGIRTYHDGQDRETVVLEASDSGCGMEKEVLSRLFEPFFTTKPAGRGIGLGLATVQGIVTQIGGTIEADSKPGKGATFRIRFPALKESAVVETPTTRAQATNG